MQEDLFRGGGGQDNERHYEHVLLLNLEKRVLMYSMYIKRYIEQF